MRQSTVSIELPESLYKDLEDLAAEEGGREPVDVIAQLVGQAFSHRAWQRKLAALREQIRRDGGLSVGVTKEEVVERLRQTRQDIFEAEYAHLYR